MKPDKEHLNQLLEKQSNKLTSTQIADMFKCFGTSCSRWNLGTYKCELGLCDDVKEAFEKYSESEEKKQFNRVKFMNYEEEKLQKKKIELLEKIYSRLGTLLFVVFFLLLSIACSVLSLAFRKTI